PLAITSLRDAAVGDAITELTSKVDDGAFLAAFGAGKADLASLVEAKTVTIAKLMDIAPAGTLDPTPGLYDTTMYLMAGLLFIALLANAFIRPVAARHHMVLGDKQAGPQAKRDENHTPLAQAASAGEAAAPQKARL
ncbi:MAG: hypothetical protein AAGA56_24915, partial [Myxococcota bacterium]